MNVDNVLGSSTLVRTTRAARRSARATRATAAAGMLFLLASSPGWAQLAGDLDASFGSAGEKLIDFNHSTDLANAVALQADGKLVVVGTTYTNNDYTGEDFAIVRLNASGTFDSGFGTSGRVTTDFPGLAAVASSVVVQPDGKIVVAGGAFPLFTFLGDFKLARYNTDGSLDTSFGSGGIVTTTFPGQGSYAYSLLLQPDGKIVAAGTDFVNFSGDPSSNTDFALARYNPDGSLDTGFGSGGKVTTDFDGFNDDAFSIVIQPDGKLVAVGSALSQTSFYDVAAVRYLANGALDPTFGVGGRVRTDFVPGGFDRALSAALQPDGKIVVGGFTIFTDGLTQRFALARYTSGGVLDTAFDGDGKVQIDFGSFSQTAYQVLVEPGGRILAVGYPNTESSDSDFLLARCNADGSLDTSFGVGGKVRTSFGNLNTAANGAVLQPDGKIVAVGWHATSTQFGVEIATARYLGGPRSWEDKGGALAGTPGAPLLFGTGDLAANSADSIVLTNARANATSALFLALSSNPVPFRGGILQPFPFFFVLVTTTNSAGGIVLPLTIPAGIPGATEIWMQWAILDPAAVQGAALSNALLGVTP